MRASKSTLARTGETLLRIVRDRMASTLAGGSAGRRRRNASPRRRSAQTVRSRRSRPGLEALEARLALSTSVGGTIVQGNLYGGQSVVLATPILRSGRPTEIQVIDTGDIGMAKQTVRTFTPFPLCSGELNLAVGDFLHKGYQQLVVGSGRGIEARVAIFDLFQTFANDKGTTPGGVLAKPVRLQTLFPFKGFTGGSTLAAGDFDGDGWDELAIGAGPGGAPRVKIYSEGKPGNEGLPANPRIVNYFNALCSSFRGGVTLAAGHLSGGTRADLIVGAGAGGGSVVQVFDGVDVVTKPSPVAVTSFQAFDSTAPAARAPAIQVQLIQSITRPDAQPVTTLDARGRTETFTPADNAPLARGTIVAYPVSATATGQVSLYSSVSDSPRPRIVQLPNTSATNTGSFRIHLTPVGYLFDQSVGDSLAPAVLVADPVRSTVSLYALSGAKPAAVKNIYATNPSDPQYDTSSFPFGAAVKGSLAVAVKLLKSELATGIAPGTSGMLPSQQVAYQSPFALTFTSDVQSLFDRYASGFFMVPENQSSLHLKDWYDPEVARKTGFWSSDIYGPDLAAFSRLPDFPEITSRDETFWRESMIAAGLQFMNRGVFYQHHHIPAWWGTTSDDRSDMGATLKAYSTYSYTPPGMQTPGLDCSDFSALVVNMVTGEKIKEGVSEQATVRDGRTDWGTSFEGTSDIVIVGENGESTGDYLSWYTLAMYFERHGAIATYAMLARTLKPGDLLYYGSIPSGKIDPTRSLDISHAAHVTIWTGQTLPIPGRTDVGVPLIMDSHGGNIQVGVDAENRPVGVVEPSGPQLRPFFIPTLATTSGAYEPLKDFLPTQTLADQNYYYLTNFTHAVRIAFPLPS